MDAKHIVIIILLAGPLLALIAGVSVMMIGGEIDAKYSNRLMVARVVLQACAILGIGILLFTSK